ncbi:MAG: YbfB/YjiJ family MFS transporter [Rhodoferax sp.]
MPTVQTSHPPAPQTIASHRRIIVAGLLALATAMGIGRFAFTPLLPMMLHDGAISLGEASWLASANYIGYLVGALFCTFRPLSKPTVLIRVGLVSTIALTLGMAAPWGPLWPWLRFLAGIASALVFVHTSGWCLTQVALRGHASLGAMIYTGPGAGIVLTGLAASAMVATGWRAASGWLAFGALALGLTVLVWSVLTGRNTLAPRGGTHTTQVQTESAHSTAEVALLALAYGVAGFGYIITATFLPVIARQVLVGSPWLDLFWPLLGCGVIAGALIASRMKQVRDLRWMLVFCYLMQAAGVAMGQFLPNLFGFALGSLLVGIPFTAITYFAMQEARRVRPQQVASTIGLLTALYGLGQILGPPLAAYLIAHAASASAGFAMALDMAAGSLLLGVVFFAILIRRYPVPMP